MGQLWSAWHGGPTIPSHPGIPLRGRAGGSVCARDSTPAPLPGRQMPPSPLPHPFLSCDWALGFQPGQMPLPQPLHPLLTLVKLPHAPTQFPKLFSLSVLAGERGRLRSRLSPALPRAPRPRGTSHHRPLSTSRGSCPAPAKCRDPLPPLPTVPNSMEKRFILSSFCLFSHLKSWSPPGGF